MILDIYYVILGVGLRDRRLMWWETWYITIVPRLVYPSFVSTVFERSKLLGIKPSNWILTGQLTRQIITAKSFLSNQNFCFKILKSTRLIKKFPEMKNFNFCRPTTYYITDSRPNKGMKEEGGLDVPDWKLKLNLSLTEDSWYRSSRGK